MKKLVFMGAIVACGMFAACQSSNSGNAEGDAVVENAGAEAVDYTVMERYFVSNKVDSLPMEPIRTQEEFDSLFGCAPVMGEGGAPTQVDFTKEAVIAVCTASTDSATTMKPLSLTRNAGDSLVFTYEVAIGDKQSYTMKPCLLIKVNKEDIGKVVLKEVVSRAK